MTTIKAQHVLWRSCAIVVHMLNNDATLHMLVSSRLLDALRAKAAGEGLTMSAYIRRVLHRHVERTAG